MNENLKRKQEDASLEIDLLAMVKAVLRGWWLVLLAMAVFGVAAYIGSKMLITPTYRSGFTAYVNSVENKEGTSVTSSEISASRSLTSTYSVIITSQPVVEEAISQAGVQYSYGELNAIGGVSVGTVDSTEIISVGVVTDDPQASYAISSALETVAAQYVSEIVTGSTMMIVTPSMYSTARYAPSYGKNTLIGVFLGFLLAVAILVIRELADNRVKDVDELTKNYGYAVIGTIHDLESKTATDYGYAQSGRKKE